MLVIAQSNKDKLRKILENNLDKLQEMGFEITYQKEDYVSLYHGGYDLGIDLYCSEIRDEYQGVYMSITRDKKELVHCKGRNVVSNITRYIQKAIEN